MLDIREITENNIEELAKMSGRHVEDIKAYYEESVRAGKKPKLWFDKPDIPEGFGRR